MDSWNSQHQKPTFRCRHWWSAYVNDSFLNGKALLHGRQPWVLLKLRYGRFPDGFSIDFLQFLDGTLAGLRQIREQHWERHGAKWWLHLIGLLSEASQHAPKKWELDTEVAVLRALDELDAKRQIINELDSCRLASVPTTYIQDLLPRALVDELLKFVRTSPLGEFRLRLKLRLEAPTCFPWNDGKDHPNLSVLLMANMKRKHPLGGSQQFDGNCDFNPAPPRFWMIWRKAFKCFMQPQGFT